MNVVNVLVVECITLGGEHNSLILLYESVQKARVR